MSHGRHRAADQTPQPSRRPRIPGGTWTKVVLPTAAAAVVGVSLVSFAPAEGDGQTPAADQGPSPSRLTATAAPVDDHGHRASRSTERRVSRSLPRVAPEPGAEGETLEPQRTGRRYVTTDLNMWSGPSETTENLGLVSPPTPVGITGRTMNGLTEVVHDGELFWVTSDYLSTQDPTPEPEPAEQQSSDDGSGSSEESASSDSSSDETSSDGSSSSGVSDAPCAAGSSVESGLASNAVAVYHAVCAEFPEVSSYGGVRPGDDGDHGSGNALDIMTSGSTGDAIAAYVQDHASELGVSYIIWEQQIWSVDQASSGWRGMEDRGSTTANHYDHVHVSVY